MATDKYLSNHRVIIGNGPSFDESTVEDNSIIFTPEGDFVVNPSGLGGFIVESINGRMDFEGELVTTTRFGGITLEAQGGDGLKLYGYNGVEIIPNTASTVPVGSILRAENSNGKVYWDENVSFTYHGTFKRFGADMLLPQQVYHGAASYFQKKSTTAQGTFIEVMASTTYDMPLDTLPFGAQITSYGFLGKLEQNSTNLNGFAEIRLIRVDAATGKKTVVSSSRYEENLTYTAPQLLLEEVQDTEAITGDDEVRDNGLTQYLIQIEWNRGSGGTYAEFHLTSIWADWKLDKLNHDPDSDGF